MSTSSDHRIEQELARIQKREAKAVREIDDAYAAWKRTLKVVEVDKSFLLKLLIAEGLAPEEATRIIATGHGPDVLTVTVSFD